MAIVAPVDPFTEFLKLNTKPDPVTPIPSDMVAPSAIPPETPSPAATVPAGGRIEEPPMSSQPPASSPPVAPSQPTPSGFEEPGMVPTMAEILAPKNDGSNYAPGGSSVPRNNAIYETQGKPLMGIKGAPRTMQKLDTKGNKTTEFVMPPDLVAGNDPVLEPSLRAALYGGSQIAKHTLGLGEWMIDQVQAHPEITPFGPAIKGVAAIADHLLNTTEFSDTDKNWIDENFATMPAANGAEKLVGDISAMIIGGGIGKKVGETALKDVPPFITKVLSRFWPEAKRIDPVNAKAKLEILTKGLLVSIPSEAAGFAATTPSNTEALTGNHLLDNLILNYGGHGIGKAIGAGAGWIGEKVFGGFKDKSSGASVLKNFMQQIDAGTANADDAEILRRAKILGEVAGKNNKFVTGLQGVIDGSIPMDTATALSMKDTAKQYIEKAYAFRKGEVPDVVLNDMVDSEAQALVDRIRGLKKSRVQANSSIIENSDADINSKAADLLTEKADNMVDEDTALSGPQDMAQPIVDELQSARDTLKGASANKDFADATLINTQQDNALTKIIEEARSTNAIGSNSAEQQSLLNMSTEQLVGSWKKARQVVNDAYANITKAPYDYRSLAETIANAGDRDSVLSAIGVIPPAKLVKSTGPLPEDFEQLATNIQNAIPDINALYTKVRPELSKRINLAEEAMSQGGTHEDVEGLKMIRDKIDEIAGKSTEPSVQAAVKSYKDFADTWLQTKPLQKFDATMDTVRDMGPGYTPKNELIAKQDAYKALQSALIDPTNVELPKFLAAVQGTNPEASADLSKAMIGTVINNIASNMKPGASVLSTDIIAQLKPLIQQLKNVDPTIEANFAQAVKQLQDAESGVVGADVAIGDAMTFATKLIKEAQEKETSAWIANLEGTTSVTGNGPQVTKNSRGAFTQLFNSREAAGRIPELMKEAEATGNPLIVEGIKSQYLRHIRDKAFSSNAVGVDVRAGELSFPTVPKAGKLHSILIGSSDNTLATLKAVFKDDPETVAAVTNLLEFLHTKVNLDTAKVFTKGSDTARNQATAQQSTQLITRMVFGPLSREGSLFNAIAGLFNAQKTADAKKMAEDMLDMLIVDPSFIKKASDLASKGKDYGLISGFLRGVHKNTGKVIIGTVGATRPTTSPVDDQTEDMLSNTTDNPTEDNLEGTQ